MGGIGSQSGDGAGARESTRAGEALAQVDRCISGVQIAGSEGLSGADFFADPHCVALTAAISAAAQAASLEAAREDQGISLSQRKFAIDEAATGAAERVWRSANVRVRVTAGEGPRDDSAGAYTGQLLGDLRETPSLDGVFDYVDGTALVAQGLEGALALGALGRGFSPVPDLQAFVVLVPADAADAIDLSGAPEAACAAAANALADRHNISLSDMCILTHSTSDKPSYRLLVERLRNMVGIVVSPNPVSVEPNHLLSLVGMSEPRIDSMIGVMGLSELAFAAALLDLVAPGFVFKFRLAGIAAARRNRTGHDLRSLYEFEPAEMQELESLGWAADCQYTSRDIVPSGSAVAAATFAVTDNPFLRLSGVDRTDTRASSDGFVYSRINGPLRVTVQRSV